MAQPRLRQSTSASIYSRHRYSVASTSTTLFTYEEEHEDAFGTTPDVQPRFEEYPHHPPRSSRSDDKGKGVMVLDEGNSTTGKELRRDSAAIVMPVALSAEEADDLADLHYSDIDNEEEDADCTLALEEEDQLDRLIRMTSNILRVSKSILSSAKRLSVSETAWSQSACGQEQEMRRNLEGLETQNRFLNVISSDAHSVIYPNTPSFAASARSPHPLISPPPTYSSVSPPPPAGSGPPRLRARNSGSSISISAPRAKTMYINASTSGTAEGGEWENSLSPKRLGKRSSSQFGGNGNSIAEHEQEDRQQEGGNAVDGLPREPMNGLGSIEDEVEALASPVPSRAEERLTPSLAAASLAKANSLPPSPVIGGPTASPSPTSSGFFSSFFSRSTPSSSAIRASQPTGLPNTPATTSPSRAPSDPNKNSKDAKALLAALSGGGGGRTPATSSSPKLSNPVSPPYFAPDTPPIPSQTQNPSSLHTSPSSPSPSPATATAASSAQFASAQLSPIHSGNSHLTISKCSQKPRHRASLSESLLRASRNGGASAIVAKPSSSSAISRGTSDEKAHRRTRQITPPTFGGLSERFWVSNVPLNGQVTKGAPG